MKKYLARLIIILLLLTALPLTGAAAFDTHTEYSSASLLLVSLDDGTVIIEKNPDEKRAPAALTGIATAITAIENCANLEAVVTVRSEAIKPLAGTYSSNMGLKADEEIKLIDLIYGLMLTSATDAAAVIADHTAGSSGAFVEMMNETARKAGCGSTVFMNPHGLDEEGHYTTARDMAALTAYALKNSAFAKIAKENFRRIEATNKSGKRELYTTNLMTNNGYSYYYAYARGIRTGTTAKAGRCVVSMATKDGYSYLGVVMGAPQYDKNNYQINTNYAFEECRSMFMWAFRHIRIRVVAEPYQTVADIKLNYCAAADRLRLVPEKEVTALVPSEINSGDVLIVPDEDTVTEINAPVKKGDILGAASILYAGEEIARVNLVAADSFERNAGKVIEAAVKKVLRSGLFIVLLIFFALTAGYYVVFVYIKSARKRKLRLMKNKKRAAGGRGDDDDRPKPPKSILR